MLRMIDRHTVHALLEAEQKQKAIAKQLGDRPGRLGLAANQ